MQYHTSADTSINSKKLPAIYKKLADVMEHKRFIDVGCGKYINHLRDFATEHNAVAFFWDPFNRTEGQNVSAFVGSRNAGVDFSICSNVLNVIDSADAVTMCIRNAVIFGNGTAYFTVFEGDGKGVGRETGTDKWQRNEKLREYKKYVPEEMDVKFKNGMMIVRCDG